MMSAIYRLLWTLSGNRCCDIMCCKADETHNRHTSVECTDQSRIVDVLEWKPHPKFAGVAMRHLVVGKDTGGRMSVHQVRIDPGCTISDHVHADMVEIHDVVTGAGTCRIAGKEIQYLPGVIGIMPADTVHRIDAGDNGLLLLATFSPPLE